MPVDKSEMKSEDALYDEAYLFVVEQQKAKYIIVTTPI